jgi:hypothetical protein
MSSPMRSTAHVWQTKSTCRPLSVGACSGIWAIRRRPVQWLLRSPIGRFNRRRCSKSPRIGSKGSSPMASTAPPGVCGRCFRERVSAPACATRSSNSRRNSRRSRRRSVKHYAPSSTPSCTGRASARACAWLPWASGYAILSTTSLPWPERPMGNASGAGAKTRKPAGLLCSPTRRCQRPAPSWIRPTTPWSGNCSP